MTNRPGENVGPEGRLRTMRILWAFFLVNIGLLALVTCFGAPDEGEVEGVPPLLVALAAAARNVSRAEARPSL